MQSFANLNGSKTNNGNFVWGVALTLAWKNLCKQIIHQPIKVKSDNKIVQQIVSNFNSSPCSSEMLSPDCYYAKAGFGNKTVNQINEQVAKKFPHKTTQKVKANLQDDSIISYAYFFKKLLFEHPFAKKQVHFNGKSVQGFVAKTKQHKDQVLVSQYKDDNNFIIQLKTKASSDHVFILKTQQNMTPQQVLQKINSLKLSKNPLEYGEVFQMPKVSLKHKRSLSDLIGIFLQNPKFSQYFFAEVYQVINFDLDQTGVKVENEGVIKMLRSGIPKINRKFILDKPFWVIMKQKNNHPYFLAHIASVD